MTSRQIRITPLVRNAVIFSITISLVFAGVWSMQDSFLANAAKPQNNGAGKDVIAGSNGFPSGLHFNLIIHGKSSFDSCGGDGGNSVFTPEYSPDEDQKMQLYINKKANSFTLNVRDRCTEAFDGDPAQVQLPTKFEDGTKITEGFWVFARVHGTPDNGKDGGDSNIVLTPDPKVEACNLKDVEEDPNSATADDCVENGKQLDVVELGFVTKEGAVYKCAENDPDIVDCDEQLFRYDPLTKGKGAKKAGLGTIDVGEGMTNSGDSITLAHILAALAVSDTGIADVIDTDADFNALLTVLAEAVDYDGCVSETDLWVFNLFDADLVIQNQTLTNDGVKNLQIRFYPQQTTEFIPAYELN